MLNDILQILNPFPYIDNTIGMFFPKDVHEEEVILTKDEKSMIVEQINNVKTHLNSAKRFVVDENFDEAIGEIEKAIDASSCSLCQKKMLISGYDIDHASNICTFDENQCGVMTGRIVEDIDDFTTNYLKKVEKVLMLEE